MAKRKCTNVACAFHDIEVETEAKLCLGCNKNLQPTLNGIFDRVDDVFKDVDTYLKDRFGL